MRKEIVYGPWAEFVSPTGTWRLRDDGRAAVAALIERYGGHLPRLIRTRHKWVIDHLYAMGMEADDQHGIAVTGAISSALKFDPDRASARTGEPIDFATYAYQGVAYALTKQLRANKRSVDWEHLVLSVSGFRDDECNGGDYPLVDQCDMEGSRLDAAHARHLVGEAMGTLTERERVVIRQRYGLGGHAKTFAEIGDGFGLTKERIRQIEGTAMRRMADTLGARREAVA